MQLKYNLNKGTVTVKQRRLSKNGPNVSALGLGCMGMSIGYGPGNDAESINTIHRAIDLGVTLIDSAGMYGWGHNEELIGKAIKGHRHKLVLATKMGFAKGTQSDEDLDFYLDGSADHIKTACDASLRRLNVDVIDLYYLHRVDPKTPIEESIEAMAQLVKAGKIRYIGISEVKPATIRRAAKVHPITAVQTEYSLWERYPETEILPTCEELGIGFVPYSPLGRGFLTGTVTTAALHAEDFRNILPRFLGENFVANQELLIKFKNMAHEKNCSMAQLALAWLLAQNENIVPIPGTKKVQYLEENLGALDIQLSEEELQRLNSLFPLNAAKGEKYPEAFECEA